MSQQKTDLTDPEQLIYHLIRMGAKGDSLPAKNVAMFATRAARKLRREGLIERAENVENALKVSEHQPDKYGFLRVQNSLPEDSTSKRSIVRSLNETLNPNNLSQPDD
jgi:hypothetical protein